MRTQIAILAATLSMLVPARASQAQRPNSREGVNVSFGFGGGTAGIGCDGCDRNRQGGTLFYVNVGGTLTRRLTLGGELNGFGYSSNDEDLAIASLMVVAHFYPEPASGFFLTGGAGLTSTSITNHLDRTDVSATGVGLAAGLGYDVRLGRNFSLTPYAQYVKGFSGTVSYNGVNSPGEMNPDYVQVGLGFTWH